MAEHTSPDRGLDNNRQRLLRQKFGTLLDWRAPQITKTIGPYEPEAFDRYHSKLEELIAACTERLKGHSDDQIRDIQRALGQRIADGHGWQAFLTNEISAHGNKTPEWYIGGFGHPDHIANFVYWARMPRFSVPELTCLSVGISPGEFSKKAFLDLASSKERPRFCNALTFIVLRYEQLQRALAHDRLDAHVSATDVIRWVDQVEFDIHPEFIEPLIRFHLTPKPAAEEIAPRKQDKREVDKIAQLFTVMAIDHLGYVPGQARSPIPKEIAELAASLGISITDETVLKYLRIGASFIPSDWKPPKG